MDSRKLIEYVITSMVIILAPGPSVLFTIARAIAWGRLVSFMTVLGNALGMVVLSTAVAVGFGPMLQSSALLYAVVQWAGGAYLIYLGVDAYRHRQVAAAKMTDTSDGRPGLLMTMRQGFVVGVLNPKAVVFFATVTPKFVSTTHGSVTSQLLVLGFIFCVLAVISDGSWGLLAGTAREWLSSDPQRLVLMRATGGVVMMVLGVAILATAPWPV